MSNKNDMSQACMRSRIHSSVTQDLHNDPDYRYMLQKCKSENYKDNLNLASSLKNDMASAKSAKSYNSSQYNSIRESGQNKAIKKVGGITNSGQFKLSRASSSNAPTIDKIRDHLAYQNDVTLKTRRLSSVGNLV